MKIRIVGAKFFHVYEEITGQTWRS